MVTKSVQEVAGSLMHHETPASWMKLWEGPEDPVQWLKAIMLKTNALATWLEKIQGGSLLSSTLDLSELFHPDTFLNALRQQTARYDSTDNFPNVIRIIPNLNLNFLIMYVIPKVQLNPRFSSLVESNFSDKNSQMLMQP